MSEASATPPAPATWTTRSLMEWMTGYFTERGVDSPRLITDMLLAHVLGCERMRLYMDTDRPAAPEELERLRDLVRRAGRHEPVQYLLGEAWFFGRPFAVDASTLIPRPSTEALVEHLLQMIRRDDAPATDDTPPASPEEDDTTTRPTTATAATASERPLRILDVGTGTGCIVISLLAQLPAATAVATDIDDAVLELAARNASTHGVAERLELRRGGLLQPIGSEETFDLIVANLPYIPDHEWNEVGGNVRDWEPVRALRGGVDGLDLVRPLVASAPERLVSGGRLALEIAAVQRDAVDEMLRADPRLEGVEFVRDWDGHWRVATARRRVT